MFNWFKRQPASWWKPEYELLAQYNAETSRGIMHTQEWKERMQKIQNDYDANVIFSDCKVYECKQT